jgi:4-hydroxyphenylpyruvate dioxygenase
LIEFTKNSLIANFELRYSRALMKTHHIEFWVGNARQAAAYYVTQFGFTPFAYRGLETGSREVASHAVRQGEIVLVFSSPVRPGNTAHRDHHFQHGDSVKCLALNVRSVREAFAQAVAAGATAVVAPVEQSDEHGSVQRASIRCVGDTVIEFIERAHYRGPFLPGFQTEEQKVAHAIELPLVGALRIDHLGFNVFDGEVAPWVEWFEKALGFHRFFSIDDSIVHTEFSGLRSIVMANPDETMKVPLIEPARGIRKSQIEEFLEYNGGAGAQHLAMETPDILATAAALRARGARFLSVPPNYYELLREQMNPAGAAAKLDLVTLRNFNIMVDQDEKGYLLQVFTMPLSDRPTFFVEFLQRCDHLGFGVNNFKTIFEAIEQEQARRGNLT